MGVDWALVTIGVVIALVALALGTIIWTATRQLPTHAPQDAISASVGQRVAVILNPSKEGAADLVDAVTLACAEARLPRPIFLETTVEHTGEKQAREALDAGADLIIAAGGDGTVRAVAAAMAHTGVPMGIIPIGTGNLFARNLDLPVTSVPDALEVILEGRERPVDLGWAEVIAAELPPESEDGTIAEEHSDLAHVGDRECFLVIAGLGFDANMIADTTPTLKRQMGWLAYFVAGMKHMHKPRLTVSITIDDRDPVTAELRTIMVGNCGLLPGGLTLLPDAKIDDGIFDIAAIDTRMGMAGWLQLFGDVVMQGAIEKPERPWRIGQIEVAQGRRVIVNVAGGESQQAQIDGDPMGRVLGLEVLVEPAALIVRAP
jgi:diacylglycerol kinase (ATP)